MSRNAEETCTTLESRKRELREQRKKIVLWSCPLRTLYYFSLYLSRLTRRVITSGLFGTVVWSVFPVITAWLVAIRLPGSHRYFMDEVQVYLKMAVWWIGLGVLSSVGLGTGMHSGEWRIRISFLDAESFLHVGIVAGILFLFPHLFFICSSAEVG
jgi:hypothetical protein